jgi:hypothetical protein
LSSPNISGHLREGADGHGEAGGEDHERTGSGEQGDEPAVEAAAAEGAAGEDRDEPDPGDAERQACAEGQDQDEPERDPVE